MFSKNRNEKGDMSFAMNRREGLKRLGYGGLAILTGVLGTKTVFAEQAASAPVGDAQAIGPALFDMLPDWSLANAENPMSMSDLVNLKDATIAFLKHAESGQLAALESALKQYIEQHGQPGGIFDIDKVSGLFLLLRIIFEIPDLQPVQEAKTFGSWYSLEDTAALKQKRESDDFHPSWPIYIARISNKLYVKSNNPSSIGDKPAYRIWDEYQYLKSKYKMRSSSYISSLEFIFIADR